MPIFRVKAKDKIDRTMLVMLLLSASCHSIISLTVAMFLLIESVKCVNLSRVSIYDNGYFLNSWSSCVYLLFYLNFAGEMCLTLMMM